MSEDIKFLVKCKTSNRYIVDVEWDGTSYSKELYFPRFYSFDTREEAERMKIAGTKVVAVKRTITSSPRHSSYKWHLTPKKKYTVRCSHCGLGTNNPRATFQIAYTEYLQVTCLNPCITETYVEIS